MANVKISQLPAGTPALDSVLCADNAAGTVTEKYTVSEVLGLVDELAPKKVHNVTQDTYFDTIWEAVAAAVANDVVTVAPGTYRELIYIDKPLTLRGPNYGKRGDDPTRGPEAVLEYSHAAVGDYGMVIYYASDDVTVEGFDIRYPDSLLRPGHNAAVTFTDDGDLVTCTGHEFANGDVIMFSARAATTGISTYTYYFVINATENTFQLASTAGGAALPLTNDGTGTIYGAIGSLLFGYAQNNLVLRNNRWYSSEIPIYIYFNSPFGNKTGGVIEGNYIDCGPFVNASSSRAIYCSDLSVTIQDNVIVNSVIGIQVSQYTTPAASVVQRNKVEASGCGLYNNAHYNGGATVTWKNNTVTLAPNDRLGIKQYVAGRNTATTLAAGIWARSMGINDTGTAPDLVVTNNVVDFTLDPAKVYNSTVLRGLLFQNVHKTVTTTINNNSFVGWTVAARSQSTDSAVFASSIDANLSDNWWGTATLSKLVLENTVASGSIVVSSVLPGKTAGDGTVLLRGFGVSLSSDVNYDNVASGLTATNVKDALDELAPRKVHNVTQDTYFDTISAAVAAAVANDVVTVAPGTYREFIYIDKPLTLRGPNYGKRGDDPTRGPEAILEYSHAAVGSYATVIYCDSDDVTVEGFDFRYPDSLLRPGHNAAVTFTDDGDLVTCTGHGFVNGDVILFSATDTTTGISIYPGRHSPATYYFVINATENTFQLASTAGGTALPLTNDGTGTIYGASGNLLFGRAKNNLVLRNNRWYSSEIPIYIYFNTPFGNKTGGVIEGNYIDCGPFVNSAGLNRGIYCSDLAVIIQDNVIVNSNTGIQVSQYTTPVASLVQRNSVMASFCGLYSNAHYNGGATVTWKNNTVTLAPNDRLGIKQYVTGGNYPVTWAAGIWARTMGISDTGTAPDLVVTNNVVDFTLDPAKVYNFTELRGLLFQDVHKAVTTTINNNSFVGWTVAARSEAGDADAVASSVDANLSDNWWGTATLSKLVLESTVESGSIVVSSVLAGKTAGDGTVLLRGFGVPLSSDVNYDNTTSGLTATNVKAAIDELDTLLDGKATVVAVPAIASSPGTPGQIAYDSSYVYVCTAVDTWLRAPIATWFGPVFPVGASSFTGNNVLPVPANGVPATTATMSLKSGGVIGAQLAGAALKVQYGSAALGGFRSGPFAARYFDPPSTQYAFALAPVAGPSDPSTMFDFTLADAGGAGLDAWGGDIVIKYVLFQENGSFVYRHAWLGTFDSANNAYTFSTVFDSVSGFAGSSHVGKWWQDPNANYDYVYAESDLTLAQLIEATTS